MSGGIFLFHNRNGKRRAKIMKSEQRLQQAWQIVVEGGKITNSWGTSVFDQLQSLTKNCLTKDAK